MSGTYDDMQTAVALVAMALDRDSRGVRGLLRATDAMSPLTMALIAVATSAVQVAHEEMDMPDPARTMRDIALRTASRSQREEN